MRCPSPRLLPATLDEHVAPLLVNTLSGEGT
jgi:hypothetical protein